VTPDGSGSAPDSKPPADSAPITQFAGIGRRFASLLYEGLLVVAVLFLGSGLFTVVAGSADTLTARVALQALLLLLVGAYFVWCWTRGGQTLPMQAWHLQIVDASDGAPPRFRRAVKRYLLAVAGTLLAGVSFLWAFVDRDRLFLHDRIAGTRIVRVSHSSAP
jgi:uncharacterized RDD family membrane protein YckC